MCILTGGVAIALWSFRLDNQLLVKVIKHGARESEQPEPDMKF